MEMIKQQNDLQEKGQVELAVFDLVGELLAITLEKHDVEIIVESNHFICDQQNVREGSGPFSFKISCEDIVEVEDSLEINLSGVIDNEQKQQETFTMFFSLSWDSKVNAPWKSQYRKVMGENSLWLQFGKKTEQLSDSVFRLNLYRQKIDGQQYALGQGRGFLVFGRSERTAVH